MNPSDQARQIGVVDSWLGQSYICATDVNPGATAVLLDTGALAGGYYDITVMVSCDVVLTQWYMTLQWRNAANTTSLAELALLTTATPIISLYFRNLKIATSERFRLYSGTGFTGSWSCIILAVRRA